MIIHVRAASKGSSILRGSPIPLGVPQNFLRVINFAISVPGRSAASDIHACYLCNLRPGCVPTPLGGGDKEPVGCASEDATD